MSAEPRATYWDYIRVEQLLSLQGGLEENESDLGDDEVRFIVIHQIDELWFKIAIRELQGARDLFCQELVPETALAAAAAALRRVATIFELATSHFRLMETMRTQDYLRFRDKLSTASGFQSAQMREIEILMGLDSDDRLEKSYLDVLRYPDGRKSPALERVQRRLAEPTSLKQAIYQWLYRTPIHGSAPGNADDIAVVQRFVSDFLKGHEDALAAAVAATLADQSSSEADRDRLHRSQQAQLQEARSHLEPDDFQAQRLRAAILFIDSNRELPLLSWPGQIIDGVIEAEQSMLVFRQRHARMVERVIGRRIGTGGSDGVDYLDQTALRYRVFKELWVARTLLLRPDLTPEVLDRDFYGLRSEA